MITGNEEMGWSDLQEQFDAVKSKGLPVDDWSAYPDISFIANVEGIEKEVIINIADAAEGKNGQSVQFIGYSDENGNFEYFGDDGPETRRIPAGANKPVYEISTGLVNNAGKPIRIIKGFKVEKK